ncbi:MICOS complex subunit MIC60 [Notechis scutatus]|uniref:MICOS complex subunit MIC60 n=1 Tax=Notechis scutatus TaxID=8663 RepID=A0A6J1V717_9SAUR|nr:MICOS complex subunit MIC60 [Notechis scutatus]
MLRVCQRVATTAAQNCLCSKSSLRSSRLSRGYASSRESGVSAGKIIGASVLFVGGGIGGTILYANYDPRFRENVEKTIPYSSDLFEIVLGPLPYISAPKKPIQSAPLNISSVAEVKKESKQAVVKSPKTKTDTTSTTTEEKEAGSEVAHILSATGEALSVPAPGMQQEEECYKSHVQQKPPDLGIFCLSQNSETNIITEIQKITHVADRLTTDDLNSLIAHAHRRIDQLNKELIDMKVREEQHIKTALEKQKLEEKKAFESAVAKALERHKNEIQTEQEKKVEEAQEVMESEMRTQLRRQAAAHADHLRDVLRIQEQELKQQFDQNLSEKLTEQELQHKRLHQEQIDNFTLDINTAYARLRGIEQAVESQVVAAEEARKAHQLWLSVEALKQSMETAAGDSPTEPLEEAVQSIQLSCPDDEFTQALTAALPQKSLSRGVYTEEALRARFHTVQKLAKRVALIDETRNSLYQYFLSYLQSLLLFYPQQLKPPTELGPEDLDTFKLFSYASYCIEHGDLELAAKFINQLKGEPRRVAQDWLNEARMTLEAKQVVDILTTYASAVGLGTTQVD